MKLCVVELAGQIGAKLAVAREGGIVALHAPPSLRQALDALGMDGVRKLAAEARGEVVPLSRLTRWLPPVPDPRTFRDFYAFEQHVKTARAKRGQGMIPEWYELAIFYFSNPCSLRGHLEAVKKPATTQEMDFELEIGCVIGKEVQDVSGDEAEAAIFGYFVLNDLSARDLQRQEMKCMLGPAKGKDFASAIGPWVVTPDELAPRRVGRTRYDLTMLARKNGREISRGSAKDMYFDFTQCIERASRNVKLFPGDLIGSGTVGTGCILELGPEATDGWLQPGDMIELEIDQLGILTTPVT